MADASSASQKPFWSDHEITMDRDGIPHYTGAQPHLMKEYRRRVLFAYGALEGDGDTAEKEAADLEKKQKRFAIKLINCLHGEAWKSVEHLTMEPERLKKKDGYKEIFAALQSIEKEGIIKKTEAFDKFFEQTTRRRGDPVDSYLRRKVQAWQDLCDLDETSSMSEDLLSYFILKGCNLSRDDRRSILLANQSAYNQKGITQSLRVSFHDIHEKEKNQGLRDHRRSGGKGKRGYAVVDEDVEAPWNEDENGEAFYEKEEDGEGTWDEEEAMHVEDEEGSDQGASGDEEVYEAYVAMNKSRFGYQEARKKLRDVQKSRGFFKSSYTDDRQQLINREKSKSRCPACHRVGHWAGDPMCPKAGSSGPQKSSRKGARKGKGNSKSKGRAAYLATAVPTFFNLEDAEDDQDELQMSEAHCFMVRDADDEEQSMQQDAGYTELDDRRKPPKTYAESDWERVSASPMPSGERDFTHLPEMSARHVSESQEIIRPVIQASVEVKEVENMASEKPRDLGSLKAFELQALCDKWGIQTSGSKKDLVQRLDALFKGEPVPKKGCAMKFLRLVVEGSSDGGGSKEVKSKVSGTFRSSAASTSPPSRDVAGGARARGSAAYMAMSAESMSKKAHKEIRAGDLEEGKPVDALRCGRCDAPMVPRKNRATGHPFFGCSKFSKTDCRFTMDVEAGLEVINAKASEAREPRSQ